MGHVAARSPYRPSLAVRLNRSRRGAEQRRDFHFKRRVLPLILALSLLAWLSHWVIR